MAPSIEEARVSVTCESAGTMIGSAAPATILRLGGTGALTEMLTRLCASLGVRLVTVDCITSLAAALHAEQPIGIACGLSGTGATAACHAIKIAARYDVGLPMLMVTDDDPETLGFLDAIANLCGVTELTRLAEPPRLEDVLAFLARAGRRSGRLALMPV